MRFRAALALFPVVLVAQTFEVIFDPPERARRPGRKKRAGQRRALRGRECIAEAADRGGVPAVRWDQVEGGPPWT